jgi:uncharacterized membrane protein
MADVDLRPMTLGEVLDRTFNLYKNNFLLFAGITALPALALLVVQILNSWSQMDRLAAISAGRPGSVPSPNVFAGAFAGVFVFALVYLLLIGYTQAATVFAVSDLYLGRTPSIGGSYKRVGSKALRVLFILFLTGLIAIVGFILLVIPGFILLCRTAVAVPASMLEDTKSVRSLERSMQLTKGHAMQIFLIFLLVWVLSYVVAIVFQLPFTFVQMNALRAHQAVSFGMLLLQHLAGFFSQILIGPIGTIAFSLMYYNLRVRKEAFDIQHLMASLGTNPATSAPSAA